MMMMMMMMMMTTMNVVVVVVMMMMMMNNENVYQKQLKQFSIIKTPYLGFKTDLIIPCKKPYFEMKKKHDC
jgi:hypothetical protein